MDSIRAYLLSVIAAALICGIINRLLDGKGANGTVTKLITGLFMAFTLISPVLDLRFDAVTDFTAAYTRDADAAVAAGESMTKEALHGIIKSRTEAYILDKAAALNAALTVEVTLSDDDIPTPVAARLTGSIAPYAKTRLQSILEDDLGIDKEHQTWI